MAERQWYEGLLRIGAVQCNFEGGRTLEVVDKWVAGGFNVEQVFHPMADSYSALYERSKHGALLEAYVQRAQAQGLRLIIYLNVHILGPSLAAHKEEWAQRTADGAFPRLYDTYYACCVNSPWRAHYFAALEDLSALAIDGVFLDGPTVIKGGCHCPACQERYRRECGGDLAQAAPAAAWEFYRRSLEGFLRESYQRFKAHKPQGVHYINLPVLHPTASHYALSGVLPYNDLVGTEGGFMFYGPPREGYLWKPSLAAKLLEAVAPDKPRLIFMAADQKPWSWYPHTPTETRLCIASSVANGAGVWYGLHGASSLLGTPSGQAAQEMMRFLAEHEALYTNTESLARVAVLYSLDTERSYRAHSEAADFYAEADARPAFLGDLTQAVQGCCDLLARSGVPYDLVTDLRLTPQRLARYDLLLLPSSACLSDATLHALRGFVADGGKLIATLETSLYDEAGRRRADFGLADVLGVTRPGEVSQYHNWNYVSSCGAHPLLEGLADPLWPAPPVGLAVEPLPQAQVLARFHGVMAGRYVDLTPQALPSLVLSRYGRGQSLYLAGSFAEFWASHNPPEYRRLLQNAVRLWARPTVTLEGGVGNLEVVLRRQGARLVLHLINYAGLLPRPFEAVAPQHGVRARIALPDILGQTQALVAGQRCRTRPEGGCLVLDLPDLHEYEVVVIE